jgi:hypothetical protein
MSEKICSTLFIKKSEQDHRHGAPIPDLYNTKYILKEDKYLSPKDLNDLFVMHRITNLSWPELIRDYT